MIHLVYLEMDQISKLAGYPVTESGLKSDKQPSIRQYLAIVCKIRQNTGNLAEYLDKDCYRI